ITYRTMTSHGSSLRHIPYSSLTSLLFNLSADHQHLPSFPTRRSSDLKSRAAISSSRRNRKVWLSFARMAPRTNESHTFLLRRDEDRKSTRLNSSHVAISYAVFCLKKKKTPATESAMPDSTYTRLIACD